MPSKSKAILGAALAAIALVALTAVPAFADTVAVNLTVAPPTVTYAHDVVVTPSITGTDTLPGDTITLQTWSSVDSTWTQFGEGDKVEETGTVSPQYISVDETFLPWFVGGAWTPTPFRAVYKPVSRAKDASGTAIASAAVISNTDTMTVGRVTTVKTKISTPKSAKRGKKCTFTAHASPNVGIGTVRFTISRAGFHTVTINATSDDSGYATASHKFSKRGTYKISARWLGNAFGAATKKSVSGHVAIH
jgi:hypothetical protein